MANVEMAARLVPDWKVKPQNVKPANVVDLAPLNQSSHYFQKRGWSKDQGNL